MNATPKSNDLSFLFDTFTNDGQQNFGDVSNLDAMLFENSMSDSLYGFMNDPGLQEPLNWN